MQKWTKSRTSHSYVLITSVSALLLGSGCREDDGRVKIYPVSGKVLVKGAPAEKAKVVFYPVAEELRKPGMPIPYAFTDAAGEYLLRSYEPDDGAPAGEFNVSVFWPEPGVGELEEPKDRLGRRYLDPKKSGLTATVPEGGGELPPFELQ